MRPNRTIYRKNYLSGTNSDRSPSNFILKLIIIQYEKAFTPTRNPR